MGLEVGTFISDLNPNWPVSTDKIREGDDHFRLIKTALLNTFPGLEGAMTLTQDDLNALPDYITALISHVVPVGVVAMWSGSSASIPTGWALCNGAGGTPDLRGKFIVGAGGAYAVADAGGAASVNSGATAAVIVVDGHALTQAELAAHTHLMVKAEVSSNTLTGATAIAGETAAGGDTEYRLKGATGPADVGLTSSVGAGDAHTHTATSATHVHTVATLPPYYALCYIMKTLAWSV